MATLDVVALAEQLAVLFAFAAVAHFAFKRLRQPVLLGEIAIGVLLGPSLLGSVTSYTFDTTLIGPLAVLGSIFLLFRIGLESDFRAVYTRGNLLVALGGVLLPFAAGFAAAYLALPPEGLGPLGTQFTVSMFVGTTLVATSVAIAAAILLEIGLVRDAIARTILGAAVVDDILGLLVLAIAVGANGGGIDLVGLGILVVLAASFIVAGILVGVHVLSRIVVRVHRAGTRLDLPHVGLVVALALAFLYAFVSEALGLSAIVGAFLAGSMFAGTPLREELDDGLGYLVAIFTPIFFISLGLQVNVPGVSSGLIAFSALLLAVAIVTKVVGCAIPARLVRMTRQEALAVGWGMTPRGEVGLIVALTALNAFVISDSLFSAVVLVIIAATVIPAPLFRASLARVIHARQKAAPPSEAGDS